MKTLILIAIIMTANMYANAEGYKVGDKAEDFNLKNVDGNYVSMADYPDAKGFVVIFTCNHCPYAVAYEDRIIELNDEYANKGYPVIAINPNDNDSYPSDSYENMIIRAEEKDFTFPYLFDVGQKVYPKYGATRTPHIYLLNKEDGDLIVKYIGAIDNNYQDADAVTEKFLSNAIDHLLEGNDPDPNFTKAIGCSIKAQN